VLEAPSSKVSAPTSGKSSGLQNAECTPPPFAELIFSEKGGVWYSYAPVENRQKPSDTLFDRTPLLGGHTPRGSRETKALGNTWAEWKGRWRQVWSLGGLYLGSPLWQTCQTCPSIRL